MPFTKLKPLGAALAVCLGILVPAGSAQASVQAHVRVVTGPTLADQDQVTGDVTIRSDPGATCFGAGTGGSGNNVNVPGPSALGIVKDASDSNGALRPLSVTDHFAFGLGVCGIGGYTFDSSSSSFWYVKVNHVGLQVGADQYAIKAGDDVLWYLTPGYPPPNELVLSAPATVQSGQPFTVKVIGYDDSGNATPVAGAGVTGSQAPTGADGTTTVTLAGSAALQAFHAPDIPSNQKIVCVATASNPCAPPATDSTTQPRHLIIGTNKQDRIKGTTGPDLIHALAGNDHVNARGGLSDVVNCGRGFDVAIVDDSDQVRKCNKVVRK